MVIFRHHPHGLSTLFFTEMWERFSYYGMRALLVLYLVNAQQFPREQALHVYAVYTALVYITPIVGGYLADRWLGGRASVMIGAVLMAMGHFAMAIPAMLYPALGLLIAGNGFFKPNISTLVGKLYEENDNRRDSGFTLFYMGINLGAFFSPLVCGTLGEKLGWHYGFAAAGVGMLIGSAVFTFARGRPQGNGDKTRPEWGLVARVIVITALLVFLVTYLGPPFYHVIGSSSPLLLAIVAITLFLGAMYKRHGGERRQAFSTIEKHRIFALAILALFVIFFWMGFEQAGGTMNLFAFNQTDRTMVGWEMPASYFQSLNPLLILLLAPLFSLMWPRLEQGGLKLSAVQKQAIGMIILGLGFVVLAMANEIAGENGKVSPMWLASVYLLHTVGELCLSPIGLSLVTKLAPMRLVSVIMGAWFAAMAVANYLAGSLETLLSHSSIPLYWFLVGSSLGAGLLLLLVAPLLHKLMHGVR